MYIENRKLTDTKKYWPALFFRGFDVWCHHHKLIESAARLIL